MPKYVQEEPENMGALGFFALQMKSDKELGNRIKFISMDASASPAPRSYRVYEETQNNLINKAFK